MKVKVLVQNYGHCTDPVGRGTVWSQVLVELNEEMDYDNFKSKVVRHQGSEGAEYEHSLHEVWSVMNRLQN